VAALLGAEQVAGAADLQVAGGDAEAGAQLGELAERLEPLARARERTRSGGTSR
jgi:hypothetical protein